MSKEMREWNELVAWEQYKEAGRVRDYHKAELERILLKKKPRRLIKWLRLG